MLTADAIDSVLQRLPSLRIGVLGDVYLDRYLDIDAALTEPSLETGLDAYQVLRVRNYPGAAGTIINNLVSLGVGEVSLLSLIGQDGEGYDLKRELARRAVDCRFLIETEDRQTPTYTKPLLWDQGVDLQPTSEQPRELSRLDLRSRCRISDSCNKLLANYLPDFAAKLDALIVLDQVKEPETGVVTSQIRTELSRLTVDRPSLFVLADSRYRIGEFGNVCLKPNRSECMFAMGHAVEVGTGATALARKAGAAVFCTCGEEGILLAEPTGTISFIAGYAVRGPIDPVGAGDSTSAGIACARAAGLDSMQAAAFGNLVASITIQQIGTTGTATPEQVRARWDEIQAGAAP